MRRRKRFLALSLAAVLVFGEAFTGSASLGRVHAEEAATEQSPGSPEAAAAEAGGETELVEESFDFQEWVSKSVADIPAGQYGDDVIKVEVCGKGADYSTVGGPKKVNGVEYEKFVKMKANGSVTVAGGTVSAEGALKITSTKDVSLLVVMEKADNPHMQSFENGELTGEQAGTAISSTTGLTFEVKAGLDYYLWSEKAKMKVWGLSYVNEEGKTVLLDFEGWIPEKTGIVEAGQYGDDVLKAEFFGKGMDYNGTQTSGSYEKYLKTREKGSATDDTIPEAGTLKLMSTKDVKVKIAIANPKGVLHMMYVDNGSLTGEQEGGEVTAAQEKEYTLQAGKEYYFWAKGCNLQIWNISYSYQKEAEKPVDPDKPDEPELPRIPAFPGAEGGGMYATGGRGGDVYVVTNLNDSGEGSLRYGIESATNEGRIIVFDVGGTINLKKRLSFTGKKNITIAGQTAPGDGITIAGYDTDISSSENIIIRFVRFRVGTENLLSGGDSMDALWGRDNDTFIIDHCTFSWNTDETLSTYRGKNGTVQWCIISESLTVSGHSKGRHGYGGIFGGDNTVFQYNLLTNHTSRNPRIGGGSMGDPTKDGSIATLQLSNNVLYNHGYYPCYGGGYAYTNYINNYVKPGPGTRDTMDGRLIFVGEKGKPGGFYISGNILEGDDAVTAKNSLGIKMDGNETGDDATVIASAPYVPTEDAANPNAFDVSMVEAEACYDLVLNSAGATYPRRDAVDARVVAQVRDDSGFYINTPDEVGGYPAKTVTAEDVGRVDADQDGIPDAWEASHSLDSADPTDSMKLVTDKDDPNYGYTWLEVYFNELVQDVAPANYVAPNPDVTIGLENNTLVDEGEDVTVTAAATANNGGFIAKVEFYNGDQLADTVENAPYTYTYTGLEDGTYNISVRAYDNEGNATQSNTSKLHVNSTAGTGDWSSQDVGNPRIQGTASLIDGVLTVKGAGKLGRWEGSVIGVSNENEFDTTDDFQYVYQQLTGDGELVAKLDSYIAVDQHTFNGLMFRESLDNNAKTAALGLTMTKIWDECNSVWTAFMVKRDTTGGNITTISSSIDSSKNAQSSGIPAVSGLNFKSGNDFNGTWLKLTRSGNTFTGSVSEDGLSWQTVGDFTVEMPETVYVGFAVEAGKAANKLENYGTAKFSNIEVNTDLGNITYELENVACEGAKQFTKGKDLVITLTNTEGYLLPETVEVTVGGEAAEVEYNSEKGTILIKAPMGDIVIKAQGVERPIPKMEWEEVDPNDLLTVEEKDGKIILTQIAESGSTSSGFPGGSSYKDAVNESWILFPEVAQSYKMTLKLTVTKTLPADGNNNNTGVFVGLFDITEGSQAFESVCFRPSLKDGEPKENVSPFWTKKDKTGNGGDKRDLKMDTVYTIEFTYDSKGQRIVSFSNGTDSGKGTFKPAESYLLMVGAPVRYGIGLIGATAEVTDLTLTDHEGNVVYEQGAAIEEPADYTAVDAALAKAAELNAEDYVSFDAVQAACDAVVQGLLKSEQERVDAMAKAIEDAIKALEKKPDSTPTPEPTATPTPEPTATPTPEPEATATPGPEATATPEPDATPTPEPEATATPEPEATATPEPEATATPEPEATATPEPEATATPEPEATPTPEPDEIPEPEEDETPESDETPEPSVDPGISLTVDVTAKKENFGDSVIENNPALKEAVKMATNGKETAADLAESMKQDMLKRIQQKGWDVTKADPQIMEIDIRVKVTEDGVERWETVNGENFPTDGIEIIVPFPSGINKDNKNNYEFTITHLITIARPDKNLSVGQIVEEPILEVRDDGLKIRMYSASPVAVESRLILVADENKESDTQKDSEKTSSPAKTGDYMGRFMWMWTVLMFAAAAGIVSILVVKYRRKK